MSNTKKNKRRIFLVLILFFLAWVSIVGRLFILQILDTSDYSKANIDLLANSVQQRKQEFNLSSGRGNIYDRNLLSLLEQKEIRTVIVFPFTKAITDSTKIRDLAEIIDLSYDDLLEQINAKKTASYLSKDLKPLEITINQQNEIDKLNIPGIIAAAYTQQDNQAILAKHLLGFLGQAPEELITNYSDYLEQGVLKTNSLIGRSGLQKTFQELLMGVGESKIAYFVDSRGMPLNGLASKYLLQDDPYYPLSLVTTIDKDIQQEATALLEKYNIKDGSVVVLDVHNADVLAMASAPDFNLDKVDPNSTSWNNKAIQAIEPGSIFKTVVAIAALSEGVVTPSEKFYCDGEIEEYHFKCYKAHGELTFEEAFAESCNITFARVAGRLGAQKVAEYAEILGLVDQIGWKGEFFKNENFTQIDNEEANRVYHANTNLQDLGSIFRTAIGQQDVRISPLAASNLVVTVLNNGVVFQPRLVDRVIYKNGNDYYKFPIHKSKTSVDSPTVYQEIRKMMEMVVDEGTATLLKQAEWQLAGKTGTAETNNDLNHQWLIGYGPAAEPRYAVAVVVKNDASNKPLAKQIFLELMDYLAK